MLKCMRKTGGINVEKHHALLVGLQIGIATVENGMEVPQKLKIELLYDTVILLLGIYLKKGKMLIQKRYTHPYAHWGSIYNSQDMKAT